MYMHPNTDKTAVDFEMVRLSATKQIVDISPNTIRDYARRGLRIYRVGKAAFISKSELATFIRSKAA
jgi:hypothetical protein